MSLKADRVVGKLAMSLVGSNVVGRVVGTARTRLTAVQQINLLSITLMLHFDVPYTNQNMSKQAERQHFCSHGIYATTSKSNKSS